MSDIILIGDLRVDNHTLKIDDKIIDICRSADLVIANLEGPIVEKSKPYPQKQNPLKSSLHILDILSDLNVSIVTLANNHIADYGEEGIIETIDFLNKSGIRWTGANTQIGSSSQVLSIPELNCRLIALAHREGPVCELNSKKGFGPTAINNYELEKLISRYKAKGERIILSYHGGEEFYTVPWPRRAEWTKSLLEKGVDLTIGHHSHSIQPISSYKSGYSIHGLGNFYFDNIDQRNYEGTNFGRIVKVKWEDKKKVETICSAVVKSDWNKKEINLSEPFSTSSKAISSLDKEWIKQCRRRVWVGNLPTQRKTNGEWWKKYIRGWVFVLKQFKKKFKSQRDIDIILSALPGLGDFAIRKMKKNPQKFTF